MLTFLYRRLPMARFWPSASTNLSVMPPEADISVTFPPVEIQDRLLDLYFAYAHPIFPVIHKGRFLREYNDWRVLSFNCFELGYSYPSPQQEVKVRWFRIVARIVAYTAYSGNLSAPGANAASPSPAPESSQTISKLLLLSMFSVAARYLDESASEPMEKIWDAGCDYLSQARSVLGTSWLCYYWFSFLDRFYLSGC